MTGYYMDTHAHLYLPEFDADRDRIVETAIFRGVKKILLPNIDSSSIESMNLLASRFPEVCYPMMGLHPTSVKGNYEEELERVKKELSSKPYCAIGEIGIDLYWDKSFLREQMLVFNAQLNLALQCNMPVAIHARESFAEILEILEGYRHKGLTGVFHAFTGNLDIANRVIGMGFKLGIGGILTYKNSGLADVIRETDLSDILLETDSPFLAPVPFRGKRNESSYIPYIAETVRQIKNVPADEIARITTANAHQLFQLDTYVGK
jgi:TatD DNase family protein